jgi:hypothetical protein
MSERQSQYIAWTTIANDCEIQVKITTAGCEKVKVTFLKWDGNRCIELPGIYLCPEKARELRDGLSRELKTPSVS